MDRGESSDAHLSQSATNLDVRKELPSAREESTFQEMVGVFDDELIGEAPAAPGIVATPVSHVTETEISATGNLKSGSIGRTEEKLDGNKRVSTPRSVVLAVYSQLLKEIEVSTLTQEELRRSEPDLASAASFLNVVTMGVEEGQRLGKASIVVGKPLGTETAEVTVGGVSRAEAKYNENQRRIRIIDAKSLLKEELAKVNSSLASVPHFRRVAYGDESIATTTAVQDDVVIEETGKVADVMTVAGSTSIRQDCGDTGVLPEVPKEPESEIGAHEEIEIATSDKDAMSVGESEEEMSDDFSVSGHSTSGGESVLSKGSRKRPADESPEREPTGTTRKGFPGVVTRSEAGCRVHLPSPTGGQSASSDIAPRVPPIIDARGVASTDIALGVALTGIAQGVVSIDSAQINTTTDATQSCATSEPTVAVGDLTPRNIVVGVADALTGVALPVGASPIVADCAMIVATGLKMGVIEIKDAEVGRAIPLIRCEGYGTTVALDVAVPDVGIEGVEIVPSFSQTGASDDDTTIPTFVWSATCNAEGMLLDPEIAMSMATGIVMLVTDVELPPVSDAETVISGLISGIEMPMVNVQTTLATTEGSMVSIVSGSSEKGGTRTTSNIPLPGADMAGSGVAIRSLTGDSWGRDAHMIEGIFRIIEGMEPPWVTIDVLETAVLQFPTVDRETLRLVIMTVMMTHRRCVVRLTRAGLRLGPCTDRDGNAFVELDLDYADRYSTSH